MKKLEIIVKPERLEELKQLLQDCGITGLMVSNIMGFGNQKGFSAQYRGTVYTVNLLPKLKVETVTDAPTAEKIIAQITEKISTGEVGDGKIFVHDIEDVVRIRTGERGENAL